MIRFHTYCLSPPLPYVPDGSWYCARCLPIVTSVESFSDSDNSNHGYSDLDHSSDNDDDTMVTIKSVVQRKNGCISSSSSDDDDDYDDSNFCSTDNEPTSSLLSSSQISSHNDVSGFITMTTDSDTPSESQQSSTSLGCAVTNSNNDSDISSPHRENISSRIKITYSNIPTSSNDCLVTDDSNYDDHKNWTISEHGSHGDNIKRRLRNHSSVNNGHQLHMRRSSTDSLVRCILSVSDSEQTDTEYFPPCGSYPCSSSHAHIKIHQVKSSKETIQSYTIPLLPVSKSRGIKRHRKNRGRKGKSKRRRLPRRPLQHLMATPTTIQRRARTAATSPRLITADATATVTDSPQSVIRRLAKARYKTESLEEARRMSQIQSSSNRLTQNDIIARQVRAQQQQQTAWWDSKVIDCYKSNTKVVCSPLKNAMRRHPLISSASLK